MFRYLPDGSVCWMFGTDGHIARLTIGGKGGEGNLRQDNLGFFDVMAGYYFGGCYRGNITTN